MKSSALMILACLLLMAIPLAAQTNGPPIDEEAIVLEVERLIEEHPPLNQADLDAVELQIRKGIADHDKHGYEAALIHYRAALAINPLSDFAHYEAAYTLHSMGDQEKALEHVVHAITINPKQAVYRSLKASVLDNMGRPGLAIETYRELIGLDPNNYLAHLNLAITYMRLDRFIEAEAELLQAEVVQPQAASTQYHLATAAQLQGFNYDEEERLEKFLELAGDDPRKEAAEARLKELRNHELQIDINAPHSDIGMMVQMIRTGWKTHTHRETFPDARGYERTYDEEKLVYSEIILPAWRKKKEEDPDAALPFYDLLLKIDDAGYLDEYIYYRNSKNFGVKAEAWIAEHNKEMEAFVAWATEAGLMAQPEEEEAPSDEDSLPFQILKKAVDSDLTYTFDVAENTDLAPAMAAEAAAYAKAVRLDGPDRIKCRKALETLQERGTSIRPDHYHPVFRCFLPGDEEWAAAERMLSTLGLGMIDRTPPVAGAVIEADGEYQTVSNETDWVIYFLAKALWRYEPGMREGLVGEGPYEPSLEEELLAWTALAQGASTARKNPEEPELEEGEEPYEPHPYNAFLADVYDADLVPGFVLFEVLHKRYGISLGRLSEAHAVQLSEYLTTFVLVSLSERPRQLEETVGE